MTTFNGKNIGNNALKEQFGELRTRKHTVCPCGVGWEIDLKKF